MIKNPNLVSRSVQSWDCCDYDGMNNMTWEFTLCVFRGHVFKYCADERLVSATDGEVEAVLKDGRPAVVNELRYGDEYDRQVARVLSAHSRVNADIGGVI